LPCFLTRTFTALFIARKSNPVAATFAGKLTAKRIIFPQMTPQVFMFFTSNELLENNPQK
jgi:hypothetical protein